ncbi:hypothetical protein M426DRAFT_321977 [Hypoxylon sp. CI-4A]|nr:hypothetical protein M426DRAFT_321977 [Hypoxylon sp. CI-4A]
MATTTTKPCVLIVGAGICGLTLAQCLRKQNIPFEVFEREAGPDSRPAGWAIGIHTIIGDLITSIPEDMPPFKESVHHLSPLNLNSQFSYYLDGPRQVVQDTPETPVVRANRFRFREWLSTRIPIQWGKRVAQVEELENGVLARFDDGTTATGDILVGADGINSIVRENLLKRPNRDILRTVPAATITGEIVLSGEAFERQLSLGHSSYIKSGPELPGHFLFVGLSYVNPDANSGLYYWVLISEDDGINKEDHWLHSASQVEKLEDVKRKTSMLDPRFTEVITATPASGIQKQTRIFRDAEIDNLPVGRVTLVGDAAHPMTPFRGEGGVHGMRDALNLSKALSQLKSTNTEEIKSRLGPYQKEILERGVAATRASRAAQRTNTGREGRLFGWGQPAVLAPEEKVSLDACRPRQMG